MLSLQRTSSKTSKENKILINLKGSSDAKFTLQVVWTYSQVHKYWDIDTILKFLALYTTTMDFKWNEQDVL